MLPTQSEFERRKAILVVAIATALCFVLLAVEYVSGEPVTGSHHAVRVSAVQGLVSLLAFAGLIYTILQQKEQLRLQRRELKLQRREMAAMARDEMRGQKQALKNQIKVAKKSAAVNLLTALLQDFRSPVIHEAMSTCHEFGRRVPEWPVNPPTERQILDSIAEFERPGNKNVRAASLVVGHFFSTLAAARNRGLLTDDLVFGFWRQNEFEVIPRVLHHLYPVLHKQFGGVPPNEILEIWSKLEMDSRNWSERHGIPEVGKSGL